MLTNIETTTPATTHVTLAALEAGIARMRRITRLGVRCEIQEDAEVARALGVKAGETARRAGLTVDEVWDLVRSEGILDACHTWHGIVDGWYDAVA